MGEEKVTTEPKVLLFAVAVEIATGLVLVIVPAVPVSLLLGSTLSSDGVPLCRIAGIALVALGSASWPVGSDESNSAAFLAIVVYNRRIALYLGAHLGIFRHLRGLLLGPAVALHAVVAVLLLWSGRRTRANRT